MTRGPRERLLGSAISLVRERGVEGTGLTELLERSGTARASIYQHFPGGKDELIEASTALAGDLFRAGIVAAIEHDPTPMTVITALVEHSKGILERSDFGQGCPIVAATSSGTRAIQTAAGDVFEGWSAELSDLFFASGSSRDEADSLASFAISALEGAIVQARARRTLQPLDDVRLQLAVVIPTTSS